MSNIDVADYVEAENGSKTLRFGDEKQQAKFELGVCMAVYKWDELNTAVENSWGGANSAEKRDWISGIVIELFEEKLVDVGLIEETLLYAMVDEFDTEVDNDSALIIADLIMRIYRLVAQRDYALVDELYQKWTDKQAVRQQQNKVVVSADPNNPDVSDESDDEDEEAPQLVEENDMDMEEDSGPIIDDDGFQMVQKGRKHR
ncbi:Pre-rRNA-processing protein TSR2 [Meyerozyma sp. JA9]|jgi:pre-rRNA-processing protein TSR2|nr:Pre-rRNA-processing protein TSR2 [Meyerozyma sp. JA9]